MACLNHVPLLTKIISSTWYELLKPNWINPISEFAKFRAISIVFLFCAALEVYVCIQFQGPAPVEFFDKSAGVQNTSNSRFSAERALEIHRRVFPDSPHPAGSVENALVRAQIVQLLEEHGWLVDPAEKSPKSENGAPATPASHGNIIARRPEQAR